jgi:DnaJ-class molecular chaperone
MPAADSSEANMYDVLGISSTSTSTQVRRAYRTLITKASQPPPQS